MLNIFYEEPDPDRWIKFDRYPRKLIRRVIRGKDRPGGVMMVALGLMAGLDKLNVPYRFNDFSYIKKNPNELACVIGKPQVLEKIGVNSPILFGAGVFSHPIDDLNLLIRYPNIRKILLPGDWMRDMFNPYYPNMVESWPVGIDTDKWQINELSNKNKILIYYKIRWDNELINSTLFDPIKSFFENSQLEYDVIKYGHYSPNELFEKLRSSSSVIFLCEHETQGIAYQQILSCNIPIFAWDRGGHWSDPSYFPTIKYSPVSSVPYWDNRCGDKFKNFEEFKSKWQLFQKSVANNFYSPRDYIQENLSLEISTKQYLSIVKKIGFENSYNS
jgi:hypothetical protein